MRIEQAYSYERSRQIYQCEHSDDLDGSIIVDTLLCQTQYSRAYLPRVCLISNIEKIGEL